MDMMIIPVVAIISGIGAGVFKQWTAHQQEMARIRESQQPVTGEMQNSSVDALRQEMAQFRDTVTQYDMSVEKTLNEIRNRLTHVESQVGIQQAATNQSQPDPPKSTTPTYLPSPMTEQPAEQSVKLGVN